MAEDCRILIVSSSLQQIFQFIERVKAEAPTATDSRPGEGNTIPWTIANKYYTANVHFEAHEVRAWSSLLAGGVPAVIFLWAHGEPYKDHAQYLSKELQSHDPEVSLAVRVQGSSATTPGEDEDVDEFLSSLGFEFVDARSSKAMDDDGDILSDGVPGLPRVIDALSTIMWPSMVQSQHTRDRKNKARELLDWAREEEEEEEEEDALRALDDHPSTTDHNFTLIPSARTGVKSQMQREMEELERWLEEEETLRVSEDSPWIDVSDVDSDMMVDPLGTTTSPMGMDSPHTALWTGTELVSKTPQQLGFDDDFTVFVSAPAISESTTAGPSGSSASGRSTPNASLDSDLLDPMHTGASYRSLGSVSDFGDHRADDEDDIGLPSEADIQATSARIFGPALLSPSSSAIRPPPSSDPLSPSQPTAMPSSASASFSRHEEPEDEVGNFDLSRVLNALQNMKEEISGMENEDERRKAAARAALGLVYGLERQGE